MKPVRRSPGASDAKLLKLCERWQQNYAATIAAFRAMRGTRENIKRQEKLAGRLQDNGWRLFDRLIAIRPTTIEGLAAQAAIVRVEIADVNKDSRGRVNLYDPDVRGAYAVLGYVARFAK